MSLNLTIMFNFGFVLGLFIVVQVISGFVLLTFYCPSLIDAFDSIQFLFRECSLCFILKLLHVNFSSLIFLLLYIHVFKGLFCCFNFDFKDLAWFVGCVILFVLLFIGFSGYSLVLGQMSYWALTVISNLLTCVPVCGLDILIYVWGNSMINDFSLRRFTVLHCIVPFILILLIIIHLLVVHLNLSGFHVCTCIDSYDKVCFVEYFLFKDLLCFVLFIVLVFMLIFEFSYLVVHPDNFIYAMIYVTPLLIEPEWYFLPYYAVLRSIPHKLLGCIGLILSACLLLYPLKLVLFHPLVLESVLLFYGVNFISLGLIAIYHVCYPLVELSVFCLVNLWFILFI